MDCYFCEKICPTGAIQCDWEAAAEVTRERVKNQVIPYLEQLEAKGKFRRLVKEVDIDKPMYKTYSKRPRFRPLD